ncbi:ornithine cyclodeaminase [Strigomonas culicis]|uniref:Ornithine cyclodeaminase n=1 Tax=Strigomonas culicis TaxID=28005 RepID=S9TD93_9TRYP|nr:ornithine cyclodeaminase [Strigomonas culicis]EPY14959.1 ornithine cyclodeaminase [Strigomonas culicis]EPY14977.1 ornithine cyclodeaminase [Strigomonas culicis]EPY14979.1 ornithine cyclodeaminase [Strigomonas culicis]|eukprot:EPY14959.1 ornithine cyclodeaminase [Strigomonas culicis]
MLDAAAVAKALPMGVLIQGLKQAFRDDIKVPLRHNHVMGDCSTLLMPAWDSSYYGLKIVNIAPKNGQRGLPGLHSTFQLFESQTGKPLAMLEGNTITSRRTAAAAALAASFLARKDSSVLLVVGAGRVASLVPEAMKAVLPIKKVMIWNHRAEEAKNLATNLRQQGFDAVATEDLEGAVRGADIVSCATLSTKPLIKAEWLRPNSHLDLIGSFTPEMKETYPECFANATVFVDTDEAPSKSGDLLEAFKAGTLCKESISATLQQLCRNEKPGRQSNEGRTVYKAVGTALEDLAAAVIVYKTSPNL